MRSADSDRIRQIEEIMARCEGAYAPATLKGYRNDIELFGQWCDEHGHEWLPAEPATIAAFVDCETRDKTLTTIKRRVEAVKFLHRMLDLPSPVAHSDVKLAMRRAMRANRTRPMQSQGLTLEMLERVAAACPDTLAGKRDAAILRVGYDSLARSYELTLLEVGHVARDLATVLIPRSKCDLAGEGRLAYLSPRTQKALGAWLDASGIGEGPLFQGLHTAKLSGQPMRTSAIRRLVKRAGQRAIENSAETIDLSGHSMRIGAAQDMMAAGLDHVAIMQAGGWKTVDVVARYVENAATRNLHMRRWASVAGA